MGPGLEHDVNLVQLLSTATCHLLNRWFQSQRRPERVCQVSDLIDHGDMRFGLIVLDDELSYQMMWSVLLGCYCRVLRPDVL
jgi:hypothetical protein